MYSGEVVSKLQFIKARNVRHICVLFASTSLGFKVVKWINDNSLTIYLVTNRPLNFSIKIQFKIHFSK
jgi:hypothetical protein